MQIKYDLFPAFVAVAQEGTMELSQLTSSPAPKGAYALSTTRVIVTDERVIVAHDGQQGPVIVFNEAYQEFDKSGTRNEDSHVVTRSGKMLAFKLDRNCGCGSRLRAWNPYSHVYSSKDPTE